MTDLSEKMLIALVDGELDDVTRRRVEHAIAEDPALTRRLAMHRRLRDRLAVHYAPVADEAAPDRFTRLLDDAATVRPLHRPAARRWTHWATGGAIAASLLIGLAIGHRLPPADGPVDLRDGAMVAQGDLARALDTQLASAPDADALIRIGVSFQRQDGGWCRSFGGATVAGVACREGGQWRLQQLVPGDRSDLAYRQAASGDPRVADTVDRLIAGGAADATAERAARDQRWRP
ncbi:hypothetical protein GGR44_001403 [Sphingobium fontiphilum]|uniref:Anti-sigma factor n=1 Tax=Sphingobium fontiphilum TaxID=944425 RepID=A0A7W6DEF7_9SPHN|nr:anti-sigma factor [Sphingobium fontiphilum]MBB3981756.1 hypothetical protein [Sphingobium fontiphilum]